MNKTSAPTDEEIAGLPRWAMAAYAVACARHAVSAMHGGHMHDAHHDVLSRTLEDVAGFVSRRACSQPEAMQAVDAVYGLFQTASRTARRACRAEQMAALHGPEGVRFEPHPADECLRCLAAPAAVYEAAAVVYAVSGGPDDLGGALPAARRAAAAASAATEESSGAVRAAFDALLAEAAGGVWDD